MMTGLYDIHTHILPGIDDGAYNMEETMKMLQMEYKDGVRTIFATSHYRKGMFEPALSDYQARLAEVQQLAAETYKDLKILAGCEFHANMDMVEMLVKGQRPTLGGSRCVLTEFAGPSERSFIKERCYALKSHGFQPIIAHAERYEAFRKHMDFLEEMVDMGVYIQLNAESIIGEDGFGMKQFCKKAIRNELVHFVGSDAHGSKHRKPRMGACAAYLTRLIGREGCEELLIENPRILILGEE